MRIIFVRHAEPDYATDTLTEKGVREATLLAERAMNWKVTDFYSSPLGRARQTGSYTLAALNREAVVYDWLQEFNYYIDDDSNPGARRIPWDFMPEYINEHPELLDPVKWIDSPVMSTGDVKNKYNWVCDNLDNLLKKYGYERTGLYYRSPKERIATNHYMIYDGNTKEHMKDCLVDDTTIVIYCHLGVMMAMMSHLINTSPCALWQGFFVAPSSVTVLATEERNPGEAYFRCQVLGDTSHLRAGNEPVSYYGYFTNPFQY